MLCRQRGIERLYPKLAEKLAAADPDEVYELEENALLELRQNFGAFAAPKKTVIHTNFGHKDAQLSADVLNAFMDEYLFYREGIFSNEDLASYEIQRKTFENDLYIAEEEMRLFLAENDIGDFATEAGSVQTLFASVEQALFQNETNQSELEGQLNVLRQQLATTSPEIDVFVEDSSSQALAGCKPADRPCAAIFARRRGNERSGAARSKSALSKC